MSLLSAIHFMRPWWLLALLALPVLAWWWRSQAQRRNPWRDVVDAHLLPHLLEDDDGNRTRAWPRWLALSAAALAIVALAGPGVGKDEQPLWQAQEPLVIALDLSSATLARDLPPTRLAQARAKLATLLRERAGGQVALVAFAGDAFTVAPLTEDAANIALFLDALTPAVMPEDGHRADRAIAWSQGLMRQAGLERGQIVLLTDRADGTDMDAASKANAAGYRVSVLGLGTARGGVFDTPEGLGQARLDAPALRRLAASGGGSYQPLSAGDGDLRALGVLDPRQEAGTTVRGQKVARWRDDGYWLLPLVMLLCLPLFRRGGALALLLAFGMLLPTAPASAQASPPTSGGSLWQRADQAEHARMQDGIAAYKQKDYPRAIERFSTVGGAEGQYNLGNALAKARRYEDAIAAYDRALALQPGMKDAAFNRNLVRLAQKLPPQQQGQGDKQDGKDGQQGKDDPGDKDGKGEQKGKQGSNQDKPPPKPGQPQPTKPPPPPGDPQSQARADAAQRERMQQALREQRAKQPGQAQDGQPQKKQDARAKPTETAEQRERRLANEAWLQRVPDDPGALLRARFLLEQQRRRGGTP